MLYVYPVMSKSPNTKEALCSSCNVKKSKKKVLKKKRKKKLKKPLKKPETGVVSFSRAFCITTYTITVSYRSFYTGQIPE